MGEFSLGMKAYAANDFQGAIGHLKNAGPKLASLADYTVYYLASSRAGLSDYPGALRELAAMRKMTAPASPLFGKAVLLEAQAHLRNQEPREAIRVLREQFDGLPQPDAAMELAQAYDAQGESAQAAALYQRVYFHFPATPAAQTASDALERLKKSMGADYPRPSAKDLLTRGEEWLAAKEYWKAKEEFTALAKQLDGENKAAAEMGASLADYRDGEFRQAYDAFAKLHLPHSEADAQRLYYLEECAQKMKDEAKLQDAVERLNLNYAASPWRLKALVSAGNHFVNARQPEKYTPLFRTAYEAFPSDPATALCHWKIAWDAYMKRAANAEALLKEQVTQYATDGKAASALYFLGRIYETRGETGAARACYSAITGAFPNFYYGVLAAEKLRESAIAAAAASNLPWLATAPFAELPDISGETPTAATKARIERARLLKAAGFPDWAEMELRFGANTDGQRHLLAIEIARNDETPALALRHMKSLTPEYLSLSYERAPKEFWRFLFPMPYRESLVSSANAQKLDPYLVAGLIRQESEFNPGIVSAADAIGLTQLIPSTGSLMARKQGMTHFSERRLYEPETNLRLGTLYLRTQLDRWSGSLEQTLAAYNAGPGRVQQWRQSLAYREPAEFVENIPFNETREYVQAVLRNAAMYRRIYGDAKALPPVKQASNAVPSKNVPKPVARKPGVRKKRSNAVS